MRKRPTWTYQYIYKQFIIKRGRIKVLWHNKGVLYTHMYSRGKQGLVDAAKEMQLLFTKEDLEQSETDGKLLKSEIMLHFTGTSKHTPEEIRDSPERGEAVGA